MIARILRRFIPLPTIIITPPTAAPLDLDIHAWIAYGQVRGYCTDAICDTHDVATYSPEEKRLMDEGWDPCVPVLRLWDPNGTLAALSDLQVPSDDDPTD